MTRRRIAYVVERFPVCSQTFVASEVIGLRRRGVEVRILALSAETGHRFITRAGLDEVTVYGASSFTRALAELQPEVIHAHFATTATFVARNLAAASGIPFTFTAHGYDIRDRRPADFLDRANAAATVVTVSERNADTIAGLGVPRERIRVVPNGVDLDRFRPGGDGEREPGLIVHVGRQRSVKNLPLLLHACALLHRRGVAFRCVLVGEGLAGATLRETCARLGLGGAVEFAGAADADEVAAWWRRASIAVLPSANEGFPVSLLEAAASGTPAVATAVGGVPELVVDGETGLLVPPADPAALAAALARLLADSGHTRDLGRRARAHVECHFSLESQVDSLLALWATM